jgi:hypothetical protein
MPYRALASFLALVLSSGIVHAQQEKVFPALTPEQLETALKGWKIEFKKITDKKANTFFYDYQTKNFNLRLYYLDGKQLLLDTLFGALPLEKVNEWNLSGKFSRAGSGKDDKGGTYTMVESRLSLKGGVTERAIKEYLASFIEELDQFETFLRAAAPRKDTPKEEKAFKEIAAERVERILDELKIKYVKVPLTSGQTAYEYQSKDTKIALTSWGKDMMLTAKFPKVPLDKVNQYNLDRKFIRAVAYSTKKSEYTSLEVNLSFAGGVTDSIVRNFISVFEEDVEAFAAYLRKAAEGP